MLLMLALGAGNRVYLIMELLPGGELLDAVLEQVGTGNSVLRHLRQCQPPALLSSLSMLVCPLVALPTVEAHQLLVTLAFWLQGHYSEADARTIFRQLVEAIQYLHSR
jgi:serine/threonine protein kinase